MNFFDLIIVVLQIILFYYVYRRMDQTRTDDKDRDSDLVTTYSDTVKEIATSFMEQTAQMQKSHFEQLEKQSSKQLVILERQTKDFMGVMGEFIAASKAPPPLIADRHLLDKVLERENSIEKEEIPEQNLEDISRIPIVDGINVQFEGQEEILPINII